MAKTIIQITRNAESQSNTSGYERSFRLELQIIRGVPSELDELEARSSLEVSTLLVLA